MLAEVEAITNGSVVVQKHSTYTLAIATSFYF